MTTALANIQVNEAIVKTAIEETLSAAILTQLGQKEQLLESLVASMLNQSVDSDGKRTSYNGQTFIKYVADRAIRAAAEQAVQAWAKENQEKIQAALRKQLDKNSDHLAKMFLDGVVGSLANKWQFTIDVKPSAK